jgi:DNA-binding Lrp family transcriptional regulator
MNCPNDSNADEMIHPREPPYIALSNGVRASEAAILRKLYEEKEIKDIAQELRNELGIEINEEQVRNKIDTMRNSGVIKRIGPIVDPLHVWNHLYFVFIKSNLAPPIIGVNMEYPEGWKDLCDTILDLIVGDELARKIVRQMYALQGTEWDMLLEATTNDMGELRTLCEKISKCGFIEKVWSFEPIKGAHHYFEPIGIPSVEEIRQGIDYARSLSVENEKSI